MLGVFKICSFRLADAHGDVKCVQNSDGERERKRRRHEREYCIGSSRHRVYICMSTGSIWLKIGVQ
jgi:hypothetical protein